MTIRIIEGLDIPIGGEPEQKVTEGPAIQSVALTGGDYIGLLPAMRVAVGDRVKLGQPLFADRKRPEILFTSPAGGIVTAINRGARRALLSVVVRPEGDEAEAFPAWPVADLATLRRDQVTETLLASGLWTALRARPFGHVADPAATPHSIFVTAIDTNPLAPDPRAIIDARANDFANGLAVILRLTEGPVFVCQAPGSDLPGTATSNVSVKRFAGPHPAGLAGTHIHFLDPVGTRKKVWHIGYQDVIAFGRLFTTGHLTTERVVALAGPMVKQPRLVRTHLGANLGDLTQGALPDGTFRVISGSVLSGRWAKGAATYLGRYHNQVSVIAEAPNGAARDRLEPKPGVFSLYRGFGAKSRNGRRFAFTSARHGEVSAMVPYGGFERVMPLDILPTHLLRALLVGDVEAAEALGGLELEEEDLALCAFVCPGKLDYGPLLRAMLEHIEKEG